MFIAGDLTCVVQLRRSEMARSHAPTGLGISIKWSDGYKHFAPPEPSQRTTKQVQRSRYKESSTKDQELSNKSNAPAIA